MITYFQELKLKFCDVKVKINSEECIKKIYHYNRMVTTICFQMNERIESLSRCRRIHILKSIDFKTLVSTRELCCTKHIITCRTCLAGLNLHVSVSVTQSFRFFGKWKIICFDGISHKNHIKHTYATIMRNLRKNHSKFNTYESNE